MRRSNASRWQIGDPHGISKVFQVHAHSGHPLPTKRIRNLLAKENWRLVLRDELSEDGPEVTMIGCAAFVSSLRKRLTR